MKAVGWILAGAGAFLTGRYIYRLNRLQNNLQPVVAVNLFKVDLSGITFRIDMRFKNPTKTALKFIFPFVTLLYNGMNIGSSQVRSDLITVPGYSETQLPSIMVQLPYNTLILKLPSVFQAITNKLPIVIQAKIMTTIKMIYGDQPWERTDSITLMQGNGK